MRRHGAAEAPGGGVRRRRPSASFFRAAPRPHTVPHTVPHTDPSTAPNASRHAWPGSRSGRTGCPRG